MYEINKNVPKPAASQPPRPSRRKYPFEEMAVGDMFFVPNRPRNTLATHVSTVGKQLGRKFSTRMVKMVETEAGWELAKDDDPNAVVGIGVWRVE